jgi:peptidoglycan/xylan/chitin deacetylase (PgdA/CDA1 family)
VLCYHAVSADWPCSYAVRPAQLEEQLRSLLAEGYHATTLAAAVESTSYRKTLVVTFDDAYVSVLEQGLPVLSRLGMPATVFVCTEQASGERVMSNNLDQWGGGPFERELNTMSWPELGQLVAMGWEVGSHTRTHARLTDLDDASLVRELHGSMQECEAELSSPCVSLAYPYGAYDRRVIAHAASGGYRTAVTCFPGYLRNPPALEWPRVCISRHHHLRRFHRKVSRAMRGFRASAAGALATRAGYRLRAGNAPRRPIGNPAASSARRR